MLPNNQCFTNFGEEGYRSNLDQWPKRPASTRMTFYCFPGEYSHSFGSELIYLVLNDLEFTLLHTEGLEYRESLRL